MSRTQYQTYFVNTEFGHLAVHYKGNINSQRAFIFLHGHLDTAIEHGSYRLFNGEDEELQILIDHRWHGSSTRTESYPSCTERCEDVEFVIEDLLKRFEGIRDIFLMGHSQGATVALTYLLGDYPHKLFVKKSFLLAPRLHLKGYLKWFDDEITRMVEAGDTSFEKVYRSKGIIKYDKKFVDEFNDLNHFNLINHLKTNSLLFRGDQDDRVTDEEASEITSLNPRYVTYFGIKDCGHYLSEEQLLNFYNFCKNTTNSDDYSRIDLNSSIYLKATKL